MTLKEIYVHFDENMKKVKKIADYYHDNKCDFKTFYKEYMNDGFYESDEYKTFINMSKRAVIVQAILTFVLPALIIAIITRRWSITLPLTFVIGLGLNFITFKISKCCNDLFSKESNLMSDKSVKEAKNNNDYSSIIENEKRGLDSYTKLNNMTSQASENNISVKIFNIYFGDVKTYLNLFLKLKNSKRFIQSEIGLTNLIDSIYDAIAFGCKNDKNAINSEESVINYVNKKFDEDFIKSIYKNITPSSNDVNHVIIIYHMSIALAQMNLYDKFVEDAVVEIAAHLVLYKIITYGLYELENKIFAVDDSLKDLLAAS